MSLTTEATRLSTQPEPVAPAGPSGPGALQAAVRRSWRQLTSMRTALLLLFLLALAAVPGAFLPQRGLNPAAVQSYLADHPTLAPILDRLSLFDVYASPWFAAVYLLLFVSLLGCLGPRIRLHARALRTPPPAVPRTLWRLPVSDRWEADGDPEQAADAARRLLRSRRWRVVRRTGPDGPELSAEKGYLRETGNLLFHVSLVVLLVGIALGGLFGFQGSVLVKEGDGFANAVFNYDDIRPGRRFDDAQLEPFHFSLEDFRATYDEQGRALTFDADLTYAAAADADLRDYTIRVNHPLTVGDARLYLIGHGYAPRVRIEDAAGQVIEQSVPCLPQGPTFLSTCVLKVPDASGEQLVFEGVFTPTTVQEPETGRVTSVYPAPDNPALTVVGYRGDLGLDAGTPQSVYSIEDRSRLVEIGDGTPQRLDVGDTWTMPDGTRLTFLDTTEWATFQVTQDPGKRLALLASVGMVIGLCLSLFVRRRRVWVRVGPARPSPAGGGEPGRRTVVEVGGLGRSGADAFASEFAELAARLRVQTTPTTDRE